MKRRRGVYAAVACGVVALGLATRVYPSMFPSLIANYAGDTLWAVMAFVTVGLAAPTWSTWRVGLVALLVSYGVEASQLYRAPWIDGIRRTPAALLLGQGFLWSDVVCYSVGVALCVLIERLTSRPE